MNTPFRFKLEINYLELKLGILDDIGKFICIDYFFLLNFFEYL